MTLLFLTTLLSYSLLAWALSISNGHFTPTAFCTSLNSLLFLTFAFIFSFKKNLKASENTPTVQFNLLAAILFSVWLAFHYTPPLIYSHSPSGTEFFSYFLVMTLVLITALVIFRQNSKVALVFFLLLLMVWLFSSIAVLKISPEPKIDLWYFGQEAAKTLLHGENPYTQNFIIPMKTDGSYTLASRYVYPPYTLLISTPFYFIFGDIRYGNLFCQFFAGLFLFGICRKLERDFFESVLICTLFLFHPRWYFVLEQGWTESTFIVLIFAIVFFTLKPAKTASAVFAGLLLAAKQYLLPLFLFYPRLFPKQKSQHIIFLVSLLLLPLIFIFWSPTAFYENIFLFHLHSEFRPDALSLNSILWKDYGIKLPGILPFGWLLILLWIGRKRGPVQLTLAIALGYFGFYFLNKQAFCNYYFFVESLLILALVFITSKNQNLSHTSAEKSPYPQIQK